jgi:hypothetical protein
VPRLLSHFLLLAASMRFDHSCLIALMPRREWADKQAQLDEAAQTKQQLEALGAERQVTAICITCVLCGCDACRPIH